MLGWAVIKCRDFMKKWGMDGFPSREKCPHHTSCRRPETRAAGFSFSVMTVVEQKSLLDLIPGPTGLGMLMNLKALLGCVLNHMK